MTTVSLTISEVFDIALKSYYAGKLAEAEQLCLKILSADPDSAATIAVSPALLATPSLIATAAAPGAGNSNVIGTPTLDGSNAQAMAALASSATGTDVLYQSMIGSLGTQAADATTASTTATNLASTASNNLSSISGVNENNEEVDVLAAQNAFQASSQVVSAITSCFQSLLEAV